MAQSNSTFIIL